ncbi:MAG: GAF domain-containing sensor histidine kinase [Chloroflexota bacterium]
MANNSQTNETEQLRQRNRELSILNTIAQSLNREVDLTQALHTALSHIVDLFALRTGWIWLLDEETDTPYLATAIDLPPVLANNPEAMQGHRYCYCLDTYQSGEMSGASNVSLVTCTRLRDLIDGAGGIQNHASVPLYAHGKPLGLLNVLSEDWRELTQDELRLLYTVGDLLSIAIERARLFATSTQYGILEERHRLAREIHDTLAQTLTAISLQLETADVLLDAGAGYDKAHTLVMQALELTRSTLEEARRSVLDLRATPLVGRTLYDAVSALIKSFEETHGIIVKFTMRERRPLSPHIEMSLYRIIQEGLNNIATHADATQVTLTITSTPQQLRLVLKDDGNGFDTEQLPPDDSYGLIGLNERVRLLGGKLDVSSTVGQGTQLNMTIPLVTGETA